MAKAICIFVKLKQMRGSSIPICIWLLGLIVAYYLVANVYGAVLAVQAPAGIGIAAGAEICSNGVDDNGNGSIDESPCTPQEICSNGVDDNGNGSIDESTCIIVIEICANGIDDDGNNIIDESPCISAGQLQSGQDLLAKSDFTQPAQEELKLAANQVNPPWQSCPASTNLQIGGGATPATTQNILTGLSEGTFIIEGTAQLKKLTLSSTDFIVKVKANFNNGVASGKLTTNDNDDDNQNVDYNLNFLNTKCKFNAPVPGTKPVTAPSKEFSQSQFFLINPPFRGCDKTSYNGAEYKISGKADLSKLTGLDSRQDVKIKLDVSFTSGKYSGSINVDDNSKNEQDLPFSINGVNTICVDTRLDT